MLLGSGSRKALESWGGELELIVLSEHFDAHFIAIDIQTGRAYIYGEGRPRRGMLIFDGAHYDALALGGVGRGGEAFRYFIFWQFYAVFDRLCL